MSDLVLFPREAFAKADGSDDRLFYAPPRLVMHIDDAAILALTDLYSSLVPAGGVILDLMSSWVSHLAPDVMMAEVIGQGMNIQELEANPRLTRRFVQNLNENPVLPLDEASCDAALCCVGVQYLQMPIAVFRDVARILRPASPFIVSFSNRCFPTKAVAIWRALDAEGHASLVRLYLEQAGFSHLRVHELKTGKNSDPLTAVVGYR